MKKTLTINLNNSVFHIDDDAYELLQSYLTEVGNHFKSEKEKADIMTDIEARIAELFYEKMDKQKNVITFEDVDAVIIIMGKPNQFVEEDEKSTDENEQHYAESNSKNKSSKKYYRDVENGTLGGVAAGLAAYLNWDVTWIRIIFVLLVFFTSATFVLVYFLMWLIVPKAVTTAQKLEMRGEDVNIQTIKNKMNDAKEYLESDKFQNTASETGSKLLEILQIFLKIIMTFVGAIISIVGVILIASLIFGLIVFLLEPEAITRLSPEFFAAFNMLSPDKIILLIISLLLIIGCPIFVLIYWSVNIISKKKTGRSKSVLWVSLILWFVGIFMFLGTGTDTLNTLKKNGIVTYYWHDEDRNYGLNYRSEKRYVAPFNAIKGNGNIKIELFQDSFQSVTVNTLREYMPNIVTEVKNGELNIYSTDNLIKPSVIVRISVDSLSSITASGASEIDFQTPFAVKKLNILLQGASKSDINLISAQKLDVTLHSASDLEVDGAADFFNLTADGACDVDAEDLNVKVANVEIRGAGKAKVYASDSFHGKAHGASTIICRGNPTVRVNETSVGSSIKYE